jgi:serine/threonine protein kinase
MLSAFGLATLVREHGGDGVPDPRYTAPEHADERFGSVDTATDVYGLGAVCYRLCTGRAPYTDDQVGRGDHVDGDPPVPSDAARGVPPALDRAVGKALAARKLTRYETVTTLAQELAAVDEGLDE